LQFGSQGGLTAFQPNYTSVQALLYCIQNNGSMVWTRFGTTQDPNAMLTVTQVEYFILLIFISINFSGFLFCVDYSSTNSSLAFSYHASPYNHITSNHRIASNDNNNCGFSESKSSARPLAMPQELFCEPSHIDAGLIGNHSNLIKWIFRSSNRLWQIDDNLQFSIAIFHSHGIV
jgi:hypothetical protein